MKTEINKVKMLHEMLNVLDKHTEAGDTSSIENYLHRQLFKITDSYEQAL